MNRSPAFWRGFLTSQQFGSSAMLVPRTSASPPSRLALFHVRPPGHQTDTSHLVPTLARASTIPVEFGQAQAELFGKAGVNFDPDHEVRWPVSTLRWCGATSLFCLA